MSDIEKAADIIASAKKLVAFSGAGISAESGIPTFRDPGGIWDQFDPTELGTTGGFLQMISRKPDLIRSFLTNTVATFEKAKPNPGHYGLAELEKMGLLKAIVTQNVDDLHSMAGNTNVLEVHGNLYRHRCLACGKTKKEGRDAVLGRVKKALEVEPFDLAGMAQFVFLKCECGGVMRIDVVMFGEAVQMMYESTREAQSCDVMLVLGTSGLVYPAAGVPVTARRAGATVIEINPNDNAFEGLTEIYIDEPSGEAMPKIIDAIKESR